MLSKQLKKLAFILEDGFTQEFGSTGYPAHFLYLDGAGVPNVNRIQKRVPARHGVKDRGFRLAERRMTLALFVEAQAADEAVGAALYDRLAYVFGPTETAIQMRITRMDDQIRQIDVYADSQIDFTQSDRIGGSTKVLVPLYAPDPSFYNPTIRTQTASINAASTTVNIDVTGTTYRDYPIVEVTGPATSLRIAATYANIDFRLQTAIPSGETFRFDFRRGKKIALRTSDGADRMSYVNPTYMDGWRYMRILSPKDLSALKIAAGGAATATMDFTVTCSGTNASSQIKFYWYNRYLSL